MVIDTDIWSKRNLVEQNLHVEDRVDRHASLAHISGHALVIGVVAAMRGQIERDRKTLLPSGQIAAVESVGLFRGREPRVLPDRPRLHDIHRAVRPAQKGRNPGGVFKMLEPLQVFAGIGALDRNVLGREPSL